MELTPTLQPSTIYEEVGERIHTVKTLAIRRPLSSRGQVVIPKDIRGFLGLQGSESVVFEVRESEVVLKAPAASDDFLDDFLNTPKRGKSLSPRQIKKMILDQHDCNVCCA